MPDKPISELVAFTVDRRQTVYAIAQMIVHTGISDGLTISGPDGSHTFSRSELLDVLAREVLVLNGDET